MASGSWISGILNTQIIAADEYREVLAIQLTNSIPVALAFGEDAVISQGIKLINAGDAVTVRGHSARGAVSAAREGIFAPEQLPIGIYQDGEIEYRPGPQVA